LSNTAPDVASIELRPPGEVMRLARLGAAHQTRLSFLRALLRRLKAEHWRFERPLFEIDADGFGTAVYAAIGPARTYSLVCFSTELPDDQRTDRVIAAAWDSSYALFDGVPTPDDIARLRANVPKQEAGRFLSSELVLSRANKSVRLFARVVDALAEGRQPDVDELEKVGYLMRTTAVYGNGKLGIADRDVIAGRPEFAGPFRAEMLAVWLIRSFTVDLAEHIARMRAPARAVAFAPALRRRLGVGNSTGLGLAPFLVRHPTLLDRWVVARETALARVRALPSAGAPEQAAFGHALAIGRRGVDGWRVEDAVLAPAIAVLAQDLARLATHVEAGALARPMPWDALYRWGEQQLSLEGQEYLVSLLLEPHGAVVDDLADAMAADEAASFRIDGAMPVARLAAIIDADFAWALGIDYGEPREQARFWYTSVEKLEPRLGERFEEPGGELEQPLGVGRDVKALREALRDRPPDERLATFLLQAPEHRHAARRVQLGRQSRYAEVHDNLLSASMRPIDLLRSKLAFFGAARFDPKSDRWLRISMFQGAPYPHELADAAEDWVFGPAEAGA
jgi:hypothetical protein